MYVGMYAICVCVCNLCVYNLSVYFVCCEYVLCVSLCTCRLRLHAVVLSCALSLLRICLYASTPAFGRASACHSQMVLL